MPIFKAQSKAFWSKNKHNNKRKGGLSQQLKEAKAKIEKLEAAPFGEYRESISKLSKILGTDKVTDEQASKIAIYLRKIEGK